MSSDVVQKISEDLHKHQIADESFQNAQQIHNLEMKQFRQEQAEVMKRIEEKLDPVVEMFANLKWGQKVLLRVGAFIGGLIGMSLGILEIIRLIIGLNKH